MAKINNYYANLIASRIAMKALEHEYAPLAAIADQTVRKIHDDFFETHISGQITQSLVDHKVLQPSCYTEAHIAGEGGWRIDTGDYKHRPFYATYLELLLEEHIALFNQHILPAIACRSKINELTQMIKQQITGKQTSVVCKKWPEVAAFVADVIGLADTAEMTTPFSDLLKQFIALPAPATN